MLSGLAQRNKKQRFVTPISSNLDKNHSAY